MNSPDPTPRARQRVSAYLERRPRLRRELYFALGALGVGLFVLPVLIYLAGSLTLGNYASGGFGSFLADYFSGLFSGWLPVWGVVLGPYAVVLFLRGLRFVWKRFLTPASA